MWLIVGLGNPGSKYTGNRHNIGFMAVDTLAQGYRAAKYSRKFQGEFTEALIGAQRVYLLKPTTFMNLSGQSVHEAAHFYKIPPQKIIVLHDELDLPLGKLRVKQGGGNGGHNGLKSIDAHLGADYWRVRLGIGHPGDREMVTNHVLSDFSKQETKQVEDWLIAIAQSFPLLLTDDSAKFMTKLAAI